LSKQWHGGKGSTRRPENSKQYADNWDKIFKKGEDNAKITERRNEEEEKEPKRWKR
jgi:hypothetical protein